MKLPIQAPQGAFHASRLKPQGLRNRQLAFIALACSVSMTTARASPGEDAVSAQLQRCWKSSQRRDVDSDYKPRFRIRFNREGFFEQPPALVPALPRGPHEVRVAMSALDALTGCQPLKVPADTFKPTQTAIDSIVTFDPAALDNTPRHVETPEASRPDKSTADASAKCNLHDWTPVARCLWEYHTENDPLPSGASNPRQWNTELAAEGRSFVARHPDVSWDHTEWNAMAANDAELAASEQAELEYHDREQSGNRRVDKQDPDLSTTSEPRSNPPASSSTIDTCDAPGVLSGLRRLSDDALKRQSIYLMLANVQEAHFDYVGIRQLSFDSASEHRVCAMNRTLVVTYYPHTHRAPERQSAPIQYEIDRQLDGDRGSYVTCKCD